MAIQEINVSTGPNTGNGDPIRAAFIKINQNFTTPANAASRMVGTQAGNLMEVGAFGFGGGGRYAISNPATQAPVSELDRTQMYFFADTFAVDYGHGLGWSAGNRVHFLIGGQFDGQLYHVVVDNKNAESRNVGHHTIRTSRNSIVDGNGFIKAASPVVKIFANKIEPNNEAKLQDIAFEKLGVGDYLIKNSTGLSNDGWYIETPKDANGNVLFSVIYTTLENGDISVKTYKKKFDFETVSIVADLDNPVDITENRWIDLRLQELPQPEIEGSESIAPPDFQPTNLAQAVAEALKDGAEQ